MPAAEALVDGSSETITDPGANVLALYRKCPHLGCNIPPLCDKSKWFECLCHGSKYNIIGEKRAGPAPRGVQAHRDLRGLRTSTIRRACSGWGWRRTS